MSINILTDNAREPDDELLKQSLGSSWELFHDIRTHTAACEQHWRHHGKKYGWKLKIHAAGKNLLEITVAEGWFLVTMAIRETERLDLLADPALSALTDVDGKSSPEGYGIKVEVRDRASCDRAKALASFIMARREQT